MLFIHQHFTLLHGKVEIVNGTRCAIYQTVIHSFDDVRQIGSVTVRTDLPTGHPLPNGTSVFVNGTATPGWAGDTFDVHALGNLASHCGISDQPDVLSLSGVVREQCTTSGRRLIVEVDSNLEYCWFIGVQMDNFSDEVFRNYLPGTIIQAMASFSKFEALIEGQSRAVIVTAKVIKDITPFKLTAIPHYSFAPDDPLIVITPPPQTPATPLLQFSPVPVTGHPLTSPCDRFTAGEVSARNVSEQTSHGSALFAELDDSDHDSDKQPGPSRHWEGIWDYQRMPSPRPTGSSAKPLILPFANEPSWYPQSLTWPPAASWASPPIGCSFFNPLEARSSMFSRGPNVEIHGHVVLGKRKRVDVPSSPLNGISGFDAAHAYQPMGRKRKLEDGSFKEEDGDGELDSERLRRRLEKGKGRAF